MELMGGRDVAILAKAFRGELVPQEETDEPSELLLARIRAKHETAPTSNAPGKNLAATRNCEGRGKEGPGRQRVDSKISSRCCPCRRSARG